MTRIYYPYFNRLAVTQVLFLGLCPICYADGGDKKTSFLQSLAKPVNWIIENWNAKDSLYCRDTDYNFVLQLQDNMSKEAFNFSTSDGHSFGTHSMINNKFGPYLGYRWMMGGATFHLGSSNYDRKSEFMLSINSQLINIDLIRRRTGGDFRVDEFTVDAGNQEYFDGSDYLKTRNIGDYITMNVTGINISYFTNHRKFSNPAGFSNGAIQLRSAGSPIVGLGFIRQHMNFLPFEKEDVHLLQQTIRDMGYSQCLDYYRSLFNGSLGSSLDDSSKKMGVVSMARVPYEMRINDLHVQLGYAYNWVLAPRLLASASVIVAPSMKDMRMYSPGTVFYELLKSENSLHALDEELADMLDRRHVTYDPNRIVEGNYGPMEKKLTAMDFNYVVRAALTYNWDKWRMGAKFQYNDYYFNHQDIKMHNVFWNASVYVGYCFDAKKEKKKPLNALKDTFRDLVM